MQRTSIERYTCFSCNFNVFYSYRPGRVIEWAVGISNVFSNKEDSTIYFNPVIILALIIQWLIAKASHLAGGVFGLLLTSGILVWRVSLYQQGNWITFLGIKLSQLAFIGLCLVWYLFDVLEILQASRQPKVVDQKISPPENPAQNSSQNGSHPLIQQNAAMDLQSEYNDPYVRTRLVKANTNLNKYCVVCGNEYGPSLETYSTKNSILAISYEGRFRKRKQFYTLDGTRLNEMDVDSIRARETAVYKREKAGY